MVPKKINDATFVDKSILAAKIDFITLKAEVDKLDINEFFQFSFLSILSFFQ